ncbi:MAG: hypothetical protein Q7J65_07875, partial [Candidatus Marinimicrobia bacterium]|nr:hypothetical protein [Candidatus Neomarinimicrobiota bacterium]
QSIVIIKFHLCFGIAKNIFIASEKVLISKTLFYEFVFYPYLVDSRFEALYRENLFADFGTCRNITAG